MYKNLCLTLVVAVAMTAGCFADQMAAQGAQNAVRAPVIETAEQCRVVVERSRARRKMGCDLAFEAEKKATSCKRIIDTEMNAAIVECGVSYPESVPPEPPPATPGA